MGDQVARPHAGPRGGRVVDRGDHLDEAVLLRDLDPEAAELAARLHLHVAEAARIEIGAVRVETLQHAVDRVLDHVAVSDGLDIFRADALEHIAEQVEQAIGLRPAAILRQSLEGGQGDDRPDDRTRDEGSADGAQHPQAPAP